MQENLGTSRSKQDAFKGGLESQENLYNVDYIRFAKLPWS